MDISSTWFVSSSRRSAFPPNHFETWFLICGLSRTGECSTWMEKRRSKKCLKRNLWKKKKQKQNSLPFYDCWIHQRLRKILPYLVTHLHNSSLDRCQNLISSGRVLYCRDWLSGRHLCLTRDCKCHKWKRQTHNIVHQLVTGSTTAWIQGNLWCLNRHGHTDLSLSHNVLPAHVQPAMVP